MRISYYQISNASTSTEHMHCFMHILEFLSWCVIILCKWKPKYCYFKFVTVTFAFTNICATHTFRSTHTHKNKPIEEDTVD